MITQDETGGFEALRAIFRTSQKLTPSQRLVLILYRTYKPDSQGIVRVTAQEMAETIGMIPTVFSRERKALVEAGWLELGTMRSNIKYYRLTPKAKAVSNVVPIRSAV